MIMYIKDVYKALTDEEVQFELNGETAFVGSILDNLDQEVQVVGPSSDDEPEEPTVIYVNKKNQLIRIKKGKKELHEILSFDINTLDQKAKHSITSSKPASDSLFKAPLPVVKKAVYESSKDEEEELKDDDLKVRKKVPIKDGVSQQTFALKSGLTGSGLASASSSDSKMTYYTLEEVAKHKSADD
eukprot:CAMPEP_0168334274 /NCGR_PEP_ID=MMETSP0213-20121227/10160_1 /TAXON_ID=151035 /ORGANISM="Euplotes harpa, Strain FSP1.4" /LENGTH=185 /DNA_ID=CAMNT_0008338867 /DNA_START=118 /DNA_END=675 /DNA_ORIENTATION=+